MIKHLLIPLLILSHYCTAQNLVPNGGFEERSGCPQVFGDLDSICSDWYSYAGSCDYFNTCSVNFGISNPLGYQQPHGGVGYAGFISFYISDPNTREHLGCQLTTPLEIGQTYYISFFVNNARKPFGYNIASNRIGFLCTTYAYYNIGIFNQLPNFNAFGVDQIISDTIGWTQVHHSFVADSAYTHLVLGNFYDDNHTDTLHQAFSSFPTQSYYYIDDVCLSADSALCPLVTGIENQASQVKLLPFYPNPVVDEITMNPISGYNQFAISDNLGRMVESGSCPKIAQILSLEKLQSGLYFLTFYGKNETLIFKLIKL